MTDLTDDMVERAAREKLRQYDSEHDADTAGLTWQDFADDTRRILDAGLGGRVPVDLPEPDARWADGAPRWDAEARTIIAEVGENGLPFTRLNGQIWLVSEAEAVGLALLAAAREARRLAEEAER